MTQTPIEAESSFGSSVSSFFNFLSKLLNSLPSPMRGWDMGDVKVKQNGDNFSSYFQFEHAGTMKDTKTGEDISNISGEKIELDVLLTTNNAQTVLAPILEGLNTMSQNDILGGKDLLNVLFGESASDKQKESGNDSEKQSDNEQANNGQQNNSAGDTSQNAGQTEDQNAPTNANGSTSTLDELQGIFAADFNRFQNARTSGQGLLGVNFEKVKTLKDLPEQTYKYDGKDWSWLKIANDFLKYGLECLVPGGDYGAVDNIALPNCSKLISIYLVDQGVIDNASEVHADPSILVLPILGRMQGYLIQYFDKAYQRNPGIQEVEDADTKAFEEEQKKEANNSQNNSQPQENPIGDVQMNPDENDTTGEYLSESKQISVKLKKITASDEIQLLGLGSNYLPGETLDDLEDIIYQDEFMNTLTEEPQSFNIGVDDDGYDIEQCEECEIDPCDSLWSVMQNGIVMYRNLYILHWMSHGNDMMKLHLLTEDMYEELIKEIDTLGELMVEKCGTVKGLDFEWTPIAVRYYEFQESLVILKDFIQNYIDTIDYAYPNQTSDVQSTLDEWLRYWNKQVNYFVKGQEE